MITLSQATVAICQCGRTLAAPWITPLFEARLTRRATAYANAGFMSSSTTDCMADPSRQEAEPQARQGRPRPLRVDRRPGGAGGNAAAVRAAASRRFLQPDLCQPPLGGPRRQPAALFLRGVVPRQRRAVQRRHTRVSFEPCPTPGHHVAAPDPLQHPPTPPTFVSFASAMRFPSVTYIVQSSNTGQSRST